MRTHFSANDPNLHKPRRRGPRLIEARDMTDTGTIKWFDKAKKYGFVETPVGDVFLHWSIVQLYGLNERDLVPGTDVRFNAEAKPGRRREATAIAFA